jgi:diguanylate cyclase (GGDEF)-like protein
MSSRRPNDRRPRSNAPDVEGDPTLVGDIAGLAATKKGPERAHFIVLAGENVGRMHRLEQSEIVIGRAADATIRLEDDGVSRRHAKVVQVGKELWLEDLKSANGTLVNGQRTERALLRDGDKIEIGATTILKFTYSDELEEAFHNKMYEAALRDGLTQAYNKRHFLDRLTAELAYARRHGTPLTLLMLDIDHFKNVNDTYGHPAGDYVLATLARIAMGALRAEDVFARYGGEEFAILCRGVTLDQAALLGERLRSTIEATAFDYQRRRIPITASIGVASLLDRADDTTRLIADADGALYEAKRAGRNHVVARRVQK